MSVSDVIPLVGADGGMLCAWLLGADLLLTALMVGVILLRSGSADVDADAVGM